MTKALKCQAWLSQSIYCVCRSWPRAWQGCPSACPEWWHEHLCEEIYSNWRRGLLKRKASLLNHADSLPLERAVMPFSHSNDSYLNLTDHAKKFGMALFLVLAKVRFEIQLLVDLLNLVRILERKLVRPSYKL